MFVPTVAVPSDTVAAAETLTEETLGAILKIGLKFAGIIN